MGPLHKTLIILKVDRYYVLFHWKRGFTVHFGLKKRQGIVFRVGKYSTGIMKCFTFGVGSWQKTKTCAVAKVSACVVKTGVT